MDNKIINEKFCLECNENKDKKLFKCCNSCKRNVCCRLNNNICISCNIERLNNENRLIHESILELLFSFELSAV